MANLEQLFLEACKKNDVEGFKSLNSKYPDLPDEIIKACQRSENPLLITACLPGSVEAAKEMARLWPQLASIVNQRRETIMHILSTKGDAEMVRIFGELNGELCLDVDSSSMTPLHRAALEGNSDAIRALVSIRPESLEKLTSNGETALHLAVKNSQSDAFQVLVDEAKSHGKAHLFTRKDTEGNTILHLATLNKLKQIVELLISENSNRRIMIRINTVNRQGQTALQLCSANSQDSVFKEIGWIIQQAIAKQSPQLPAAGTADSSRNQTRWTLQTRNVLLVVVVTIAAAFFTVTCNLPDSFLKEDTLAVKTLHVDEDDILSKLPTVVYIMIVNSAGFLTTMFAIVLLVWPLHFRTFVIFLVICTAIVYILLVDEIIPKFYVKVGKSNISSNGLVWSLVLALILFGMSVLSMGKFTLSFWRFIISFWTNRTNRRDNNLEDLHEITAL